MAETSKPEEVKKLIEQMREWFDKQSHLPQNLDDKMLKRFLHSCYYDLEASKTAADLFFKIRASVPDIINDRDPRTPHMQKIINTVNLALLKISGNRNLFIWQVNDPGLKNFNYDDDIRLFLLSTDAWILSTNNWEDADIILMDVKDLSLKFITKINLSLAKRISRYHEDAAPIRLKQLHVVNAPWVIEKIYGFMKPLISTKVKNMIYFHAPKSETLYDYLDKTDLPEDYGGTLDRMDVQMKSVLELIDSLRESLLQENMWMADTKSKSDQIDATKFHGLTIV